MSKTLLLIIYYGFYSAGATSEIVSWDECVAVQKQIIKQTISVTCVNLQEPKEPTP